jgi:hypothetical protein
MANLGNEIKIWDGSRKVKIGVKDESRKELLPVGHSKSFTLLRIDLENYLENDLLHLAVICSRVGFIY